MTYQGVLTKMQTEWQSPIHYYLVFKDSFVAINQLLSKKISLTVVGYECLCCNKPKKIFRQGFCYDCHTQSASAGNWIMRPELSTAHLGIEDRDLEYEKKVQLQPHIVYLALSSDVKVGVTRGTQVPTRWIDQGATQAIPIVEVPNRYLAGITEVALKKYFTDKTSWQKMLKNELLDTSLKDHLPIAINHLPDEVKNFVPIAPKLYQLEYPVLQYPKKVNSLNLEKTKNYQGQLVGIKGQYLIFEDQTVLNIRSYEGYVIQLRIA